MVFPWFSHGFPMVFLWFSYGFPCLVGALQLELAPGRPALPHLGGPAAAAQGRAQRDAGAAESGAEPWVVDRNRRTIDCHRWIWLKSIDAAQFWQYLAMAQNDQPPSSGWCFPTKHDQKSVGHLVP